MPNSIENKYHEALADEAATLAFGARLSSVLTPPLVIFLHGQLGAGKTTLVRGVMRGLGFMGRVTCITLIFID
jgi:tRNA threonylcarbamoyladenosine biosynthesis protein TsaE